MRKAKAGLGALLSLTLVGCGGGDALDEGVYVEQAALKSPPVTLPGDELGPVVVSRTMDTGNIVRIYDLGAQGALVLETGEAYSEPTWKPSKQERQSVLEVWAAIAPGEAAPSDLTSLHSRLRSGQDGTTIPEPKTRGIDSDNSVHPKPPVGPVPQVRDGCNNGCCDYDWMYRRFDACHVDYDYDWMHFNSTSGYANVNDVYYFEGFVCSAIGTSRWRFTLGSAKTVDIDVTQAHYVRDFWFAPVSPWPWDTFYDEDLRSTVNKNGSQMHTYCGGADKE